MTRDNKVIGELPAATVVERNDRSADEAASYEPGLGDPTVMEKGGVQKRGMETGAADGYPEGAVGIAPGIEDPPHPIFFDGG